MTAFVLTIIIVVTFIAVFATSAATSHKEENYRKGDKPRVVESAEVACQATGGLVLLIAIGTIILSLIIAAGL